MVTQMVCDCVCSKPNSLTVLANHLHNTKPQRSGACRFLHMLMACWHWHSKPNKMFLCQALALETLLPHMLKIKTNSNNSNGFVDCHPSPQQQQQSNTSKARVGGRAWWMASQEEARTANCQRQAQCSPPWLSPKGSSHAQASKTCTKVASTKASQEETRTANVRGKHSVHHHGWAQRAQAMPKQARPAPRWQAPRQSQEETRTANARGKHSVHHHG